MRSMSAIPLAREMGFAPREQSFIPLYSPVLWLAVTQRPPSTSWEPMAK